MKTPNLKIIYLFKSHIIHISHRNEKLKKLETIYRIHIVT